MIEKGSIETFKDVINEDSLLKNIKRMFIMKKMETYKIIKINIEYDEIIKSFKINFFYVFFFQIFFNLNLIFLIRIVKTCYLYGKK